MPGVVAPFIKTEGIISPYVSVTEVLNSATAASVDFTNLVPNASLNAQTEALKDLIVKASAKADNYCLGALGTLCATVNTENGRYSANRLGQFVIQPYFWPIVELKSFEFGYAPGDGMTSVTLNNSNTAIERYQFIITNQYGLSQATSIGGLNMVGGAWGAGQMQFCQYTYVNGFANTFTSAAITAGDTSLTVDSVVGLYAGMTVTIWDGAKDEQFVISSSWDGTSLTIPTVSPLIYSHTTDTNVSTMPATVKQAVIHFIVAMAKERGAGGLVINELGEPLATSSATVTQQYDEAAGYDLLDDFIQVWGRA
jgi:hypothetical protein